MNPTPKRRRRIEDQALVQEIDDAYPTHGEVIAALIRANQEIDRLWRLIDQRCEECGQKLTQQTGFVLDDDDWLFCSEECRDRASQRHGCVL